MQEKELYNWIQGLRLWHDETRTELHKAANIMLAHGVPTATVANILRDLFNAIVLEDINLN